MIVLDASAFVELVLGTRRGSHVARKLASPRDSLHAPHLLDVEVAQVLRRYESIGVLTSADGAKALDDLGHLDLVRYGHDPFLPRIWELRHNATAYDACYLALAEVLDAPLITCDVRLARSSGHRARIDLIS